MVALAATVVSTMFPFITGADELSQLYAAIYEWHKGSHHSTDFSANAYLDVYQGHVNTLTHISEGRNNAFHVMMNDIYTRAM